jgi:hypothetical protein
MAMILQLRCMEYGSSIPHTCSELMWTLCPDDRTVLIVEMHQDNTECPERKIRCPDFQVSPLHNCTSINIIMWYPYTHVSGWGLRLRLAEHPYCSLAIWYHFTSKIASQAKKQRQHLPPVHAEYSKIIFISHRDRVVLCQESTTLSSCH